MVFSYNQAAQVNGDWPSGKALGSGPRIGGSNPSSPAKHKHYRTPFLNSLFDIVNIMNQSFADMLAEDGKKNSLGRVNDVLEIVLSDQSRLEELYKTISHQDAWVRMRAVDAFEKVCRIHPEWIKTYIDKIQIELSGNTQPSIQWHIAQIYSKVELKEEQKIRAIEWLVAILNSNEADWIVAANSMDTLADFVRKGDVDKSILLVTLDIQKAHKSNAVVKRVNKLLSEFA